jgi:hypothetical protein
LAELDYIEVLERCKDGYESDVTDIEDADFKCNEEESEDSAEEMPGTVPEDKDFMASVSNSARIDYDDDKGCLMTLNVFL